MFRRVLCDIEAQGLLSNPDDGWYEGVFNGKPASSQEIMWRQLAASRLLNTVLICLNQF